MRLFLLFSYLSNVILALLRQLSEDASLVAFAKTCIVPHLASAILKKEHGIPFLQGELKHYDEGLEENFLEYFGINIPIETVPIIFERLGEKKEKPINVYVLVAKI